MSRRAVVPQVHSVEPEEVESPAPSEVPRQSPEAMSLAAYRASFVLTILMVLVAIGAVAMTWKLQERVRKSQEDVAKQAEKFTTEMEQLRTDVILTTTENSAYLKVMLLKPGIDKGLARDIAHSVVIRAREHHRDVDFVLAIIDTESNFNPHAVSNMGAVGLMQIMPFWKESLAIDRDLRDVDTSINYGLKILAMYEKTYGSLELALTVYNRGPQLVNADLKYGRTPYNGYAESIMRTYSRIKAWTRP